MEDIQPILDYASDKLTRGLYLLLLRDDPAHHAPKWHKCGILGHIAAVVAAARQLASETGEDVVRLALYHDIGKIRNFPDAIALVAQDLDPVPAYRNHESWSARIAAGISPMHYRDRQIIREHALGYTGRPVTIVNRFEGEPDVIRRWMLLCAADAVGKGWTPDQCLQRPEVAQRFEAVATLCGIPASDRILTAALAAVWEWQLPPVPRFTDRAEPCPATT